MLLRCGWNSEMTTWLKQRLSNELTILFSKGSEKKKKKLLYVKVVALIGK